MAARLITGIVVGFGALALIILGGYWFGALIAVAGALAVFEFIRALKSGGWNPMISPGAVIYLALPLALFSKDKSVGSLVFGNAGANFFPFLIILAAVVSAAVFVLDHKNRKLEDAAGPFLGACYITLLLWCGYALREMPEGIHLLLITLVGSVLSDTCAFAFGSLFGKKKLCPEISPKKTVVGMWAAFAGGTAGVVIYGAVLWILKIDTGIPVWAYPFLGVLISAASQAGDLFASSVKRQCNIKDFGKLLPGHGGLLDRIDSYLPSFAVTYIFVSVAGIIAEGLA